MLIHPGPLSAGNFEPMPAMFQHDRAAPRRLAIHNGEFLADSPPLRRTSRGCPGRNSSQKGAVSRPKVAGSQCESSTSSMRSPP